MQLMLKQGCRGKNKQRMDTNPPAKPTETQSAVLVSYSITPAASPQKGASFVTEILVWGCPKRTYSSARLVGTHWANSQPDFSKHKSGQFELSKTLWGPCGRDPA